MAASGISVSVATFEFKAAGKATRLKLTEQGAYLDGARRAEDAPGFAETRILG